MKLEGLSIAEKVGQMFMCGFHGPRVNKEIEELIENYHLGGVIYFRRNIKDVQQVAQLSAELQQLASKSSSIPLYISIDQEGGMVARIDREVTLTPGNMALGATRDMEGVYEAARISGKELQVLGINMNFAPSIDVNNNPLNPVIGVRSYSESPDLVKEMGRAAIRGFQEAGVSATVKHFPGHGDTETDSHYELPRVQHPLERLFQVELVPFIGAIEEGVDAIMTAHVLFPAIESSPLPATLSQKVLTNLLREQLGYSGLIVTDCLEMKAISEGVGVEEGAVLAIEAGADLILVSHTFEKQKKAMEQVLQAVESGRLTEQRINESVERILRLKEKRIGETIHQIPYGEVLNHLGNEQDKRRVQELSEKSITLVKDENQLPLKDQKTYVIWTEVRSSTEVDEVIEQEETLGACLSSHLSFVEEERIGVHPIEAERSRVLERSRNYSQVVFVSYNATFSSGQIAIVKELAQREECLLVVAAARNPYDLLEFPEVKSYLTCYENRPTAMKSLAKVLVGQRTAQGKLPVSISPQYPFGWTHTSVNMT